MSCYYQGCSEPPATMEHIPPKSFFPKDQRNQLLKVPSCKLHNNAKSYDDVYVLAHICLNASPSNRSREIFMKSIVPQLGFNRDALRKTIAQDSAPLGAGAVAYKVNVARFDRFFSALSCGIVRKAAEATLPPDYDIGHIYHNFQATDESPELGALSAMIGSFYTDEAATIFNFGRVEALNTNIYSAKVFGISDFRSSITIVHQFFEVFRVTSMLSKQSASTDCRQPRRRAIFRLIVLTVVVVIVGPSFHVAPAGLLMRRSSHQETCRTALRSLAVLINQGEAQLQQAAIRILYTARTYNLDQRLDGIAWSNGCLEFPCNPEKCDDGSIDEIKPGCEAEYQADSQRTMGNSGPEFSVSRKDFVRVHWIVVPGQARKSDDVRLGNRPPRRLETLSCGEFAKQSTHYSFP
jgi:hypothetical protein